VQRYAKFWQQTRILPIFCVFLVIGVKNHRKTAFLGSFGAFRVLNLLNQDFYFAGFGLYRSFYFLCAEFSKEEKWNI
jgi:hypothetical protein